ncbi:MAG: inverse autotransporter beta domain-containing protein [Pirellulales bacterium]
MLARFSKAARSLTALLVMGVASAAAGVVWAQEDPPAVTANFGATRLALPDSYLWLRHNIGDGVGYRDSFSNLGAFVPLSYGADGNSIVFAEPRVLVTNSGKFGANAGLGFRTLLPDVDKLFGMSVWYDRDNGHTFQYDQLGGSWELLGENWDFRTNCFFPLGSRNRLIYEQFDYVNPSYLGRNIFLGTVDRARELALRGADLELGYRVPNVDGLRVYGGYYYYQGEEVGAAHGARVRATYQFSDAIEASYILTDDRLFGTNNVFSVTLKWPGVAAPRTAVYPEERLNILTQRHDRVVAKVSQTREQIFAQDRFTGKRIDVVHVDDDAAPGGDGSYEHPVSNLADASGQATTDSILFVRSGTYTDGIVLSNGQRLLGDGLAATNPHMVSSLQGVFELPEQTSNPLPILNPASSEYAVFIAPRAWRTEVAGFDIRQTNEGAGIGAVGSQSFYIHDNLVSASQGYGILLLNPTTDGQWVNGSALDHRVGIFNNQVTNSPYGGIAVAHTVLTKQQLIDSGIDPVTASFLPLAPQGNLAFDIQGNTVSGNAFSTDSTPIDDALGVKGRFGIAVASNTGTTINTNISDNEVTGNGAVGADVNGGATDGTGGISVAGTNGARINATVDANDLTGNRGIGIVGVSRGSSTQVVLNATGNSVSEQDSAWMNNPNPALADPRFRAAVGIGGIADNGELTMNLRDNTLEGGESNDYEAGVFLVAVNDASLTATLQSNQVFGWNDEGIGLRALDASNARLTLNAGHLVHNNGGHGLLVDAEEVAGHPNTATVIVDILGDNQFYENGQSGMTFSGEGNSQTTLLVDGATVYGNNFHGIQMRYDDAASFTGTIRNSTIRTNGVNGVGGYGIQAQSFSTAPLRLTLLDNLISGNPTPAFPFSGGVRLASFNGVLRADVSGNLFGTQVPGGTANAERDLLAEASGPAGSGIELNFTSNTGDAAQGFEFRQSGAAFFDLYTDGNNSPDNGDAGWTTSGTINYVVAPIVFP